MSADKIPLNMIMYLDVDVESFNNGFDDLLATRLCNMEVFRYLQSLGVDMGKIRGNCPFILNHENGIRGDVASLLDDDEDDNWEFFIWCHRHGYDVCEHFKLLIEMSLGRRYQVRIGGLLSLSLLVFVNGSNRWTCD